MGQYSVEITREAREHLRAIQKSGNKALMKKVEKLFRELAEHPREGVGRPEMLKYELSNIWSRRIDQRHRLLYTIEDEVVRVIVLSMLSHYGDK